MSRDQETSEVPENLLESGILRDVPKNKDDVLFHNPEYRWLLQDVKCLAFGQDVAEREIDDFQQVTFLEGDKEIKSVTDGVVGLISSGPVIDTDSAFPYQYPGRQSWSGDLIRGDSGFLPLTTGIAHLSLRNALSGLETSTNHKDRGETAGDYFRSHPKKFTLLSKTRKRTLRILNDALNKKDDLLLENAEDLLQQQRFRNVPLISPSLVENLIATLEKVKFCEDRPDEMLWGRANEKMREKGRLGPPFWAQNEYLGLGSRPGTLILETARFLGYELFPDPKEDGAGKSGRSLTAYDVCWAFETWMNHDGFYRNNEYSCCGEKARDSVCVASKMSSRLH